jgi:hypothetical protein
MQQFVLSRVGPREDQDIVDPRENSVKCHVDPSITI